MYPLVNDPSRLSQAEAAYLRKHGVEIPSELDIPQLDSANREIWQAVNFLAKLHPPNPVFDIPGTDVLIACVLYGVDDIRSATDRIGDAFSAINVQLSQSLKTQEPPNHQRFIN